MHGANGLVRAGAMALLFSSAAVAVAAPPLIPESRLDELRRTIEASTESFTGVWVDPGAKKIFIGTNPGVSVSPAQVAALLPSKPRAGATQPLPVRSEPRWSVTLVPAKFNAQHLKDVFERIRSEEPWASLVTPVLQGWSLDIEKSAVVVNVTAASPQLREAARRAFGDAVQLNVVSPGDQNVLYSRTNDYAPWDGGIPFQGVHPWAWWETDIGRCTASFSVTDGGIDGFLTAGHCFGQGAAVRQADGEWVGSNLGARKQERGLDYGLVGFGDGYRGFMWVNDSTVKAIHPDINFWWRTLSIGLGDIFCFNGAVTGERCAARIGNITESCQVFQMLPGIYTESCGLMTVHSSTGQRLATRGDSGGPVYTYRDGKIWPRGIIIGGNAAGTIAYFLHLQRALDALEADPNLGNFDWTVIVP